MTPKALLAMTSMATGSLGLLAIALLATRHLTPAELGFFFSFLSFGGLLQLADFGISYAALQAAGSFVGTGRLEELPDLASSVSRWNLATTAFASTAVAGIGWLTFSSLSGISPDSVRWRGPWAAYVLTVFVTQLVTPGTYIREGAGKVTQMWRLRFVQEWVSALACLLVLHVGGGLWSLAAFALFRALVPAAWLAIGDPLRARPGHSYTMSRWISEVWPFQWRIALSGLSGYLVFRAFSPIILVEKGPVAAGEFGLAIAIMNVLIAVSTAWPASLKARYAALIAAKRFDELRTEFPAMLSASSAVSAAGAAGLILALWKARQLGVSFALHLPDLLTMALVLLAAVAHHMVACAAVYLRAEGREPLFLPAVLGGGVTAIVVWLTAHFGSLRQIALAYLLLTFAGIPIAFLVLRTRQRRWSDYPRSV